MKQVGSYQAKTHLPALLERVSKGERITITKHGVPIALLVPAQISKIQSVSESIVQLKKFRQGHRLGLSIRSMKQQGRK